MGRPFVRRMAFMAAGFLVLMFLASALAVAALSGLLGLSERRHLVPVAAILGLLLVIGIVGIARAARRTAGARWAT
jgi:hypothetical protein